MSDAEIMGHVEKTGEGELTEMIEHWVTVIERWVTRADYDLDLDEASGLGAPVSGTGVPSDPEAGAS